MVEQLIKESAISTLSGELMPGEEALKAVVPGREAVVMIDLPPRDTKERGRKGAEASASAVWVHDRLEERVDLSRLVTLKQPLRFVEGEGDLKRP